MQEVRFITNSFSAEYGRSAGGVVVAAGRSGNNQIHGSVYDYLRNDKLNANSWANNRSNVARGRQRRNDYGFTSLRPGVAADDLRRPQQDVLLLQLGAVQRPRRQHTHGQRAHGAAEERRFLADHDQLRRPDPHLRSPHHGSRREPDQPLRPIAVPGQRDPGEPHGPDHEEDARLLPGADAGGFAHAATQLVAELRQHRQDRHAGSRAATTTSATSNRLFFRYGYETTPRTSPYTNIAFPGEGTNGGGNQDRASPTRPR